MTENGGQRTEDGGQKAEDGVQMTEGQENPLRFFERSIEGVAD